MKQENGKNKKSAFDEARQVIMEESGIAGF